MIRINDDWIIDVDERNYTLRKDLHRVTKSKDGTETPAYKTIGYFSAVSKALDALGEEIIREHLNAPINGLQELADAFRAARAEWRELVEGITG